MAEKKETKAAEKKTTTKAEPKVKKDTDLVKVNLLKPRGEKEKFFKTSLNGKDYIIPYGEEVEVPIGVKEIIDDSIAAMENAEIYEEEHTI